jgi:predicted nucleic acid-binding protein
MSKDSDETKILLDADVIRNFIDGEKLDLLPKIFPNSFCIIDRVKNELCKSAKLKPVIETFIKRHKINQIKFPEHNYEFLHEYAILTSTKHNPKGDGESACLAYARFNNTYISSSNLSDVAEYCKEYGIRNIPTMDLLEEALKKKLITEKSVDVFLCKSILKGDKLPAKTWKEYVKLIKK